MPGLPSRFQQTGAAEAELGVDVLTVDDFATDRLGDPRRPATPLDWLSLTGQAVLEVTAGAVFEDDGGELTARRAALEWYPDDVWRYVVACTVSARPGTAVDGGARPTAAMSWDRGSSPLAWSTSRCIWGSC